MLLGLLPKLAQHRPRVAHRPTGSVTQRACSKVDSGTYQVRIFRLGAPGSAFVKRATLDLSLN